MEIITVYGKVLENRKYTVGRNSDLPYPKELIREAIIQELLNPTNKSLINALEIAYVALETFVPDNEFVVIREFEEAVAKAKAIIRSGEPESVKKAAVIIAQERTEYSEIQGKIVNRQRERLEELERLRQRNVEAQEIYYLPKIGCQFSIPYGFKKSDSETHSMVEEFRTSLYPKNMSFEEKKRRANLESVFYKELDDSKWPLTPFFTVQIRDIGRPMAEEYFEKQVAIFKRMEKDVIRAFENVDLAKMIDYIITKKPVINYENHSVIMTHQIKLSHDDAEGYLIQYFRFYRTGLLILNFYSGIDEVKINTNHFKTIIDSMKFSKNTRWQSVSE